MVCGLRSYARTVYNAQSRLYKSALNGEAMFCPKCGNEIKSESSAFCTKCGTKLAPPPSQTQANYYQTQQSPQGQYASPPGAYLPSPGYGASQQQGYAYGVGQYAATSVGPEGKFSIIESITNGWGFVMNNLVPFLLGTLIFFILMYGVSFAIARVSLLLGAGPNHRGFSFLQFVSFLINYMINVPLLCGLFVMGFKAMNGQAPEIGDIFKGFSRYVPIVIASFLVSVITGVWLVLTGPVAFRAASHASMSMLLIIPVLLIIAIYFGVSYMFTLPLILDQNLDFWTAMETSRRAVNKCWFSMFFLVILCFLLNVVGVLALCVGVLFTFPVGRCAYVSAYAKIFPCLNELP